MRRQLFALPIAIVILSLVFFSFREQRQERLLSPATIAANYTTPTPTPTPIPSPTPTGTTNPTQTPTPKPAGPCVDLPVLMYHHIQQYDVAKTGGYSGLTVTPDAFQKQLAYLNDKKYNSVSVAALIAFFDSGISLPKKPIMLTFDDGYDDFATYAAPLLSQYGIKSSMFLPTGLMENPGYLKWSTIASLAGQGIYFGNHTWSHRSMGANLETDKKEITTAQTQLDDHDLNVNKVFVYPYGTISPQAIGFLRDSGYNLAFTTIHGRLLCRGARLTLPRIRIGNDSLSAYGL